MVYLETNLQHWMNTTIENNNPLWITVYEQCSHLVALNSIQTKISYNFDFIVFSTGKNDFTLYIWQSGLRMENWCDYID